MKLQSSELTLPDGEGYDCDENCCEHGDHPAPDGQRFCSEECANCEIGRGICGGCRVELLRQTD
jgi:hypothetical protein